MFSNHSLSSRQRGKNPFRRPTTPRKSMNVNEIEIPVTEEKPKNKLKFPLKKMVTEESVSSKVPQKPKIDVTSQEAKSRFAVSDLIKRTATFYFEIIAHKYPMYRKEMRGACKLFLENFNKWMKKKGAFAQMKEPGTEFTVAEMEQMISTAQMQINAISLEKKAWKDIDLNSEFNVRPESQEKEEKQDIDIDSEAHQKIEEILHSMMLTLDAMTVRIGEHNAMMRSAINDTFSEKQEICKAADFGFEDIFDEYVPIECELFC